MVSPPTPQQQLRRDRVEGLIALAAPFLDLVLAVGERVARVAGRDDDYIPIRSPADALELAPPRRGQGRSRGDAVAD